MVAIKNIENLITRLSKVNNSPGSMSYRQLCHDCRPEREVPVNWSSECLLTRQMGSLSVKLKYIQTLFKMPGHTAR